ncbi:MAG: hypothetical protein ACYDCN_13410 [Bacteroidia bacterium]
MEDFRFYIDQKITTWQRVRFTIKAETENEATEKATEFLKDPDECPENGECEIIHEANQDMSVEENEGNATRELYNEKGQEIANNTEGEHINP